MLTYTIYHLLSSFNILFLCLSLHVIATIDPINKKMKLAYFTIFFLLLRFSFSVCGFGSMGPIAASFGSSAFFCAIDASGKQAVACWGKNSTGSPSEDTPPFASGVPPVAALSGGENFLCGILSDSSQVYCWDYAGTHIALSQTNSYSHLSAGKSHVCAVRGSYYSNEEFGLVDCWDIVKGSGNKFTSKQSNLFYDPSISNLAFKRVESGEGFTCGGIQEGGIACWGPKSSNVGISKVSDNFTILASGLTSLCGVSDNTGEINCWGNGDSVTNHPVGTRFVSLTAGADHYCGIREDNHEVACWGNFNSSMIPKGSGFMAIASSESVTCGIRENDLVLDCWFANEALKSDYDPPLQLCSPGLCTPGPCGKDKFSFNASTLNEPDLTSLCVRKDLNICSPCGLNCSQGFFISSPCSSNSDRVCTACSLCQNSSCSDVCKLQSSPQGKTDHDHQLRKLVLILGSSVSGFLLFLIACCLLNYIGIAKNNDGKMKFGACIGKDEIEKEKNADPDIEAPISTCPGIAQVFRLTELKDATNGFKEFNELGRGSYGFVYKAVLADGRHVAVKRANAATIIHRNSREFEMELEVLCNVRHHNIVNLLGYCSEMGERLLVYEYMPHGTLHDHLHGGLSPLSWTHRLKIAMQAAKGLDYLHSEVSPPIVHRDVKSSNILLDLDWSARIADFGLLGSNERDCTGEMRDDVYSFGVILLEILSGRKGYDKECTPPSIIDWAVPLIRKGKAAALIDRYVALPRNVEPLLKLAEIAELTVRENSCERPTMTHVAASLEQLVRDGLIL